MCLPPPLMDFLMIVECQCEVNKALTFSKRKNYPQKLDKLSIAASFCTLKSDVLYVIVRCIIQHGL